MRDGEGGVGFGLWVLGSWDGRGCVEWEEPIKERRVWEKGGDDGVGSVCGEQGWVREVGKRSWRC